MQPMVTIALRAARSAGELIFKATEHLDKIKVQEKEAKDYVSEVDKASEELIITSLRKAYPNHGFWGEESGLQKGSDEGTDYLWIIDPLDGTTNFLRGVPHYAVSIACQYRGRIEHAVIYDPVRQEEFTASRGRGAAVNGRRIRVSSLKSLDGALLGTGIPFKSDSLTELDSYLCMLRDLVGPSAGIRRAGAASLDLAYVAAGRYDAFWEYDLAPWDMAAGLLLIQEAGGLVSDFVGAHNSMDNGQVVAGNPKCFKAVLQTIQPHLTKKMKG